MVSSYWDSFTRARQSRRRVLTAAGGIGLGAVALSLIGCGGGGEQSGPVDRSGFLSQPVNTTNQAKAGGTLKDFYTAEILHFDALASNSSSVVNQVSAFAYPRIMRFTSVEHPKENDGSLTEGDLAESYEISPARLTYTFKLRQGLKWDSKAPTSGRVIDTQDVLFSWKKFAALNPAAANLVYDATKYPNAPVESVTAPDSRTIVLKLHQPEAALLTFLAGWDQWYTMPRESEGGFDPRTEVRGYGPWILDAYQPSAYTYWKRNPDYHIKGRPFIERWERALVPEYAARLSHFKAGNIYTDVVSTTQQDVIQLKRDVPAALVRVSPTYSATSNPFMIFGWEGNSIFKDTRVRQAMSMAIDREAFADAVENRPVFEREGLEMQIAFNTILSPTWGEHWLDPKDEKKFGPNVKYLKLDQAEAKKLLAAAGYPNGVEFDFFHNRENTYGPTYARMIEIYQGMFAEVGLRANLQGQAYAVWQPQYYQGYITADYAAGKVKGFSGAGLSAERPRYTPAYSLYGILHPEGDVPHGATADGNNATKGDPKLNADLAKLRQETDREKAISMAHDAQRYITQQAYIIPKPTNPKPFTVFWPAIGNLGVFKSSVAGPNRWVEEYLNWWLDTTKPPFTQA